MMISSDVIYGQRIYLRMLKETDATEEYCSWLNDSQTNRYLATKKATVEELKEYIKKRTDSSDCLFFGVFIKENNNHIGNVKLEPIDFKNKIARVGIMIGDPEYRGKGIGPEILNTIIKWSFDKLGMEEVDLGVRAANKIAIRAYEKAGFKVLRVEKLTEADGMVVDNIIMSVKK